jgi:hypothetical protein
MERLRTLKICLIFISGVIFEQVSCSRHQKGQLEDKGIEENGLHSFSSTKHVTLFRPASINYHSLFLVNSIRRVWVCSPMRLCTNSRKYIKIADINCLFSWSTCTSCRQTLLVLIRRIFTSLRIQTRPAPETLGRERARAIQRDILVKYLKIWRLPRLPKPYFGNIPPFLVQRQSYNCIIKLHLTEPQEKSLQSCVSVVWDEAVWEKSAENIRT